VSAGDGPAKPPEEEGDRRAGPAPHLSRAEAKAALRRRRAAEEATAKTQVPASAGEAARPSNLPALAGAAASSPPPPPPAAPGEAALPAPADAPPAKRPLPPARTRPAVFGGGANENRKAAPSRAAAAAHAAALDAPMVPEEAEADPFGIALGVLLRIAAIAWLAAAVWMWGRLVGYADDVIVPAWHAPGGPWLTTLTAAVVYPVVAVGLWLRGRWGIVLWAAAVAAEVSLVLLAPALLPFGVLALAGNLVALAAAAGLGIARALARRDD